MPEKGEDGLHLGGTVFIGPVHAHERVEDDQSRLELLAVGFETFSRTLARKESLFSEEMQVLQVICGDSSPSRKELHARLEISQLVLSGYVKGRPRLLCLEPTKGGLPRDN